MGLGVKYDCWPEIVDRCNLSNSLLHDRTPVYSPSSKMAGVMIEPGNCSWDFAVRDLVPSQLVMSLIQTK